MIASDAGRPRPHHTPGPWEVRITDDICGDEIEIRMGEALTSSAYPSHQAFTVYSGADAESMGEQYDELLANARLIAAAPDLLVAAKHAVMEWRLHGQLTDSCRVLEQAIAKAEGI